MGVFGYRNAKKIILNSIPTQVQIWVFYLVKPLAYDYQKSILLCHTRD